MTQVIINIRGTGGSGKSHLVQSVMDLYPNQLGRMSIGRKRPHYYVLSGAGLSELLVPGHYEIPTGGCDTIKTVDEVYGLVQQGIADGVSVLYEGIMVMGDVTRAVALDRDLKQKGSLLQVIGLTTPIEDCLAGIHDRRTARGDTRPLDPTNTVSRAKQCARGLDHLAAAGVKVLRLDRTAAFTYVREQLTL